MLIGVSLLPVVWACSSVIQGRCFSSEGDGYCLDRTYCVPTNLNHFIITNGSCNPHDPTQVCCVVPVKDRPSLQDPLCQPLGSKVGRCLAWQDARCGFGERLFRGVCQGETNVQCCASSYSSCPNACEMNPCLVDCPNATDPHYCPQPIISPSSNRPPQCNQGEICTIVGGPKPCDSDCFAICLALNISSGQCSASGTPCGNGGVCCSCTPVIG